MNVDKQVLKVLAIPLLEEHAKIYIAVGCGRVYAAPIPSVKCNKCDGIHENHEISSIADIDEL